MNSEERNNRERNPEGNIRQRMPSHRTRQPERARSSAPGYRSRAAGGSESSEQRKQTEAQRRTRKYSERSEAVLSRDSSRPTRVRRPDRPVDFTITGSDEVRAVREAANAAPPEKGELPKEEILSRTPSAAAPSEETKPEEFPFAWIKPEETSGTVSQQETAQEESAPEAALPEEASLNEAQPDETPSKAASAEEILQPESDEPGNEAEKADAPEPTAASDPETSEDGTEKDSETGKENSDDAGEDKKTGKQPEENGQEKKKRYKLLISLLITILLVLVLLVVLFVLPKRMGGGDDSYMDQIRKQEIKENDVAAVDAFFNLYYTALASGNTTALESMYDDPTKANITTEISTIVNQYDNIEVYVTPGIEENEIVAFVYNDIHFANIDATAPSVDSFYLRYDEDEAALKIATDMYTNQDILKYMNLVSYREPVRSLLANTNEKLSQTLADNKDLNNLYILMQSMMKSGGSLNEETTAPAETATTAAEETTATEG